MAVIYCQHNIQHRDIASAKHCGGHQPVKVDPPATSKQVDYIVTLGGDRRQARALTKSEASTYITRLLSERSKSVPVPNTQSQRPKLVIPLNILAAIKDGYYAVRADESVPYTYLRVNRPKTGRLQGATKIQTQHSDDLADAMVVYPNGTYTIWKAHVQALLPILAVNQRACAIEYGRTIGRCCVCGKTLTDERSRYYGIGPDCETRHHAIIEDVEEQHGPYVPSGS